MITLHPMRWWYLCFVLLVALLVSTSHAEEVNARPLKCEMDLPLKDSRLLKLRKDSLAACEKKDFCSCMALASIHELEGNGTLAKTILQNLCTNSPVIGACFRLGMMQVGEDDFLNAEKSFRLSCVDTGSEGCEQLSEVSAVNATLTKTLTALTESCEKNNMKDCVALAKSLDENGRPEEAEFFYKRACDKTVATACLALADFARERLELAEARRIYLQLCKEGNAQGCNNFGSTEEERKIMPLATMYYDKACTMGEGLGCVNLGDIEARSNRPAKSQEYYQLGCQKGSGLGCFMFGSVREKAGDIPEATVFYKKACDSQHHEACARLGGLLAKKGEYTAAREKLTVGCEKGLKTACSGLAQLEAISGNRERAKHLFRRACSQGMMSGGCFQLAELEEKDTNFGVAYLLYERTCENDFRPGCEAVKRLTSPRRAVANEKKK